MPRITSKGQVTIPQDIRNKFGFLPGMEVDIIAEGNKALIVKSRRENRLMNWLGVSNGGAKRKLTGWLTRFEADPINSVIVDTNVLV
jgi:AbrB family looped-hinge helix DNA binding protein